MSSRQRLPQSSTARPLPSSPVLKRHARKFVELTERYAVETRWFADYLAALDPAAADVLRAEVSRMTEQAASIRSAFHLDRRGGSA